jgi:SAM-dependent methyltransferase
MLFYIIFFIIFLVLFTFAYAALSAAPFVPTWGSDVKRIIKAAAIKPGQKFYDLGSGDGRLLFAAYKAGALSTGFEISLLPYFLSSFRRLFVENKKNYEIKYKSFWQSDLSGADIVYIFLFPEANSKLRPKFEQELKKGAKVIAYTWPIIGWIPIEINKQERQPTIYIYER